MRAFKGILVICSRKFKEHVCEPLSRVPSLSHAIQSPETTEFLEIASNPSQIGSYNRNRRYTKGLKVKEGDYIQVARKGFVPKMRRIKPKFKNTTNIDVDLDDNNDFVASEHEWCNKGAGGSHRNIIKLVVHPWLQELDSFDLEIEVMKYESLPENNNNELLVPRHKITFFKNAITKIQETHAELAEARTEALTTTISSLWRSDRGEFSHTVVIMFVVARLARVCDWLIIVYQAISRGFYGELGQVRSSQYLSSVSEVRGSGSIPGLVTSEAYNLHTYPKGYSIRELRGSGSIPGLVTSEA
ncbi:hypothetical protein LXL04_039382 [Taraxacum kok-saghyz]